MLHLPYGWAHCICRNLRNLLICKLIYRSIQYIFTFFWRNENEMIEKKGKGRLSVFVVVKHMSFQPSIQYVLFIMFPCAILFWANFWEHEEMRERFAVWVNVTWGYCWFSRTISNIIYEILKLLLAVIARFCDRCSYNVY